MKHIGKVAVTSVLAFFAMAGLEARVTGTVASRPVGTLRSLGAELDPHFFSQHIVRSAGAKAEDWDVVVRRVKTMQLHRFRVMVLPQWYEPQNDNADPSVINWDAFHFDTDEMESLCKVLDLAEEEGIRVTLTLWGARVGHFLAPADAQGWVVAPADAEEFAENFVALTKYLLDEKGYTCVDELTPINEPDGAGSTPESYIALCKALDAQLQKEGLRERVKLNLIDNTDRGGSFDYINACAPGLKGVADLADSHTYHFGYDTPNTTIQNWERANRTYAAKAGVAHMVGEFGSNQTVGASRQRDIDQYERGVFLTRVALNLLGAGACGLSYWQLFDQYYDKGDGYAQMQQLGLWKSVRDDYAVEAYYPDIKEDYQPRPQYYAYALLTHFLRPGAEVFPVTNTNQTMFAGLGVRNPDGHWVYVFANQTDADIDLYVRNSTGMEPGRYEQYVYAEDKLPSTDALIAPESELLDLQYAVQVAVPQHTVVLLRYVGELDDVKSVRKNRKARSVAVDLQGRPVGAHYSGIYVADHKKFLRRSAR